jgi:molybdopterin synthase catalytic subunit
VPRIRLTHGRLEIAPAYAELDDPACGGVVLFAGRVRPDRQAGSRVVRLDYEADRKLALRSLEEIAASGRRRFGLGKALLWHRTGPVRVGEVSVIVGAAAPHRAQAFRGARWMIDRLKSQTPIWKTERAPPERRPPRRPGPRRGRSAG